MPISLVFQSPLSLHVVELKFPAPPSILRLPTWRVRHFTTQDNSQFTTNPTMANSIPVGSNDIAAKMAEIATASKPPPSKYANRYRGATVEDLDPPSALSCNPTDPISHALLSAFERDYTHLTVVSATNRALLGYLSIPHLQILLKAGKVQETDEVAKAMVKFRRKGKVYKVITMDTPLEELELFFNGGENGDAGKQEFAVVTDERRRFVLGVATRTDLEEFARRRPA